MKDLDAAAVRRLLSRWDYAPEAIEAYGRAMERAMRNAGAHEALERAVDGYEAGGGSIRIHSSELQAKIFKILGEVSYCDIERTPERVCFDASYGIGEI